MTAAPRPPALIVGGSHNALSVARSLGQRGIRVHSLVRPGSEDRWSRFSTWIPLPSREPFESALERFLLGPASESLHGAVLLAAGDEALLLLSSHRDALAAKFRLDLCNPAAQRLMLDKLGTYRAARDAGVPTPRFWVVESRQELESVRHELAFPLIVKPRESHLFQNRFRAKFFVAENAAALDDALRTIERAGMTYILVEKIPGPDALLCSYYTYLDAAGTPLFEFTKRILRRYPTNMGLATYHITDHVPELREPSLRLFRHVGLQGVANVEFKRDPRDGVLKLMECNARFTAANRLLEDCGLDLAWFVYSRIAGLPSPHLGDYPDGMRLWDPLRDLRAFAELHQRGELGAFEWLRSILHRQTLPVFAWSDPLPAFMRLVRQGPGKRHNPAAQATYSTATAEERYPLR